MNGDLFVTVAAELATGKTEAHFRSAVSRAYYGAFHAARRLLSEVGISLPKVEQMHAKAIFCLQDCGAPFALEAATDLEALRRQRNRADYELDRTEFQRTFAETQVAKARHIAATLQRCRSGSDAAEFRAKARAQAKLLGLPVSQ